ncbi:MAG: sodium ion-translocating decarboxylase subunit beta [Dehalococcoidia bacterium]|nr:sodium ion-translocating decarboxylase subunit beta [Dehalococcoidia bacterium]
MNSLIKTGFDAFGWHQLVMVFVACLLVYLGIKKKWEPLLLIPLGFAILSVNLFAGLVDAQLDIKAPVNGEVTYVSPKLQELEEPDDDVKVEEGSLLFRITLPDGTVQDIVATEDGRIKKSDIHVAVGDAVYAHDPLVRLTQVSVLAEGASATGLFSRIFEFGIANGELIPCLIFLGLGTLTDFGPLIANPKMLFLGAAAQGGVFIAFFAALAVGEGWLGWTDFGIREAASIGIIGGADGPTTIFLTSRLSPQLLGTTAVAAYTYMAMVPLIQPPVIRLMTSKEERAIYMKPQLREVSRLEKILFPFIGAIAIILLVPESAPLISMFMFGNLLQVSGVVDRLAKTAGESFMDILIIFLGISVGSMMTAENFIKRDTLIIFGLGIFAFASATAIGIIFAKVMGKFSEEPINPLIGAAGVSAVPMSARVVQRMGQEANPRNFLIMHAMGPNVAGVIGTAVVAGALLGKIGG